MHDALEGANRYGSACQLVAVAGSSAVAVSAAAYFVLASASAGPGGDGSSAGKRSELEDRIRSREQTVNFEVVDNDDRAFFRVGPDGAQLFDKRSRPVVDVGASAAGG